MASERTSHGGHVLCVVTLSVFIAATGSVVVDAIEPRMTSPLERSVLLADGTTNREKQKSKPATRVKAASNVEIDREQEQSVLRLVQTHLPELVNVLDRLRDSHSSQYAAAIRDLGKSARRLELAQKRDEALFELELEILKARSNVNLLTARLKVHDSESSRKRLREAAERLQNADIARAEYELTVLRGRVERAEEQLAAAEQRMKAIMLESESQLEKSYLSYLRKAGRQVDGEPTRKKK